MYNMHGRGNGININSSPEPAGYLNGASHQTFVTPPLPTAMPKMIVYYSRGVIYTKLVYIYLYVFVYKTGSQASG